MSAVRCVLQCTRAFVFSPCSSGGEALRLPRLAAVAPFAALSTHPSCILPFFRPARIVIPIPLPLLCSVLCMMRALACALVALQAARAVSGGAQAPAAALVSGAKRRRLGDAAIKRMIVRFKSGDRSSGTYNAQEGEELATLVTLR